MMDEDISGVFSERELLNNSLCLDTLCLLVLAVRIYTLVQLFC